MFTIWTVLPVSFVIRGKERKRSQQACKIHSFYIEMQKNLLAHAKKTSKTSSIVTLHSPVGPYRFRFKPTSFVLVCICDQKWDYKLELSEINQRFSGNTAGRPIPCLIKL